LPDGCREKVSENDGEHALIMEKSEVEKSPFLVDDFGVLLGYFGMNPGNYVLPEGIKIIRNDSFGDEDRPKTIVLNEDLEVIGDYALHKGNIWEVTIPKSVEKIGEYGCSACRKVYMYRSTEYSQNSFRSDVEIIYLD
jgi:hypothetical protein